jgi:peptidoglycan/LPS O-acetylase OafA/YrhL
LQYYLLIAGVWTLAKRIPPNLGLGLLALSAWLGYEHTGHDFITHWLAYFNLGILLALHFESKIKTHQLPFFAVANLAIIWLFQGAYYTLLGTLGFSSIYFFPHLKGGRVLSFLGRQSYSLYLIHGMVGCSTVNIAMRFLDYSNPFIQLRIVLVALLVSVISAEVLYRAVERPTMRKSKSIALH